MKILNIFNAISLLVVSAFLAACEPELGVQSGADVVPNFPNLIENYAVEPGSVQTIGFSPNLDWKISIPSEIRQWFWIQDETFKVSEMEGKASTDSVFVYIGVTETADFDKNYVCDVTLEMGDSSKVVAKYMLPAKEKSIQLYVAKKVSETEYELAEDGSYVYSEEQATSLDLIWSEVDKDFRIPVKVVSNCEWDIQLPEWAMVNVPESTVGVVEMVITGVSIKDEIGKLVINTAETSLLELDITVPACGGIDVYSASVSDGEFEFDEGGDYLWSEKPVDDFTLSWLGSDFRMAVKIDSRCNWTVRMPEWLTVELPETTAGEVVLTFLGVPSKYEIYDVSSKVLFYCGDSILGEITVNLPGCRDIMSYSLDMSLTSLEYNYRGNVLTSNGYVNGPVTGSLIGYKTVRVTVVETTNNVIAKSAPSWFTVEVSNWNTADGADVLQQRTMTFNVTENKADDRSAVLFILPPGYKAKGADLFNEDITVKEEYVKYAIPIHQRSMNYDDYLSMEVSAESEFEYSLELANQDKKTELTSVFGETEHVYVLTYESPYCRDYAALTMAIDFDSYKVFSDKNTTLDVTNKNGYWLTYTNEGMTNSYGVVDMYLNSTLPQTPSVGYVVFYSSDKKVLAIVECVSPYDPEMLDVEDESLMFVSQASEKTVNVISNVAWTVESSEDWCKVTPTKGSREGQIKISVLANETDENRTATLTLKTEHLTKVISVVQHFGDVLEPETKELEFECLASEKTLSIVSNVSWTISSDADWCTVNVSEGKNDSEVLVSVKKNYENYVRKAVITLKSENKTVTVNVSQLYDDGSTTNGDELVHFLDWRAAKMAEATLVKLTDPKDPLYKKYKDGDAPVYHLTYSMANKPLRIVLPTEVRKHNVNPYVDRKNILVNGKVYDETFGSTGTLGEVDLDDNQSVEVSMILSEGKTYMRGNVNFTKMNSDAPIIILICTIDVSTK